MGFYNFIIGLEHFFKGQHLSSEKIIKNILFKTIYYICKHLIK